MEHHERLLQRFLWCHKWTRNEIEISIGTDSMILLLGVRLGARSSFWLDVSTSPFFQRHSICAPVSRVVGLTPPDVSLTRSPSLVECLLLYILITILYCGVGFSGSEDDCKGDQSGQLTAANMSALNNSPTRALKLFIE